MNSTISPLGRRVLAVGLLASFAPALRADVVIEESFPLAVGWNLIHVPVEPLEKDPRVALSAIAWESLWTWLPTDADPLGGRWLVLHKDAPSFLATLSSFSGPRSYVISATASGTLRVRGRVRADRQPLPGRAYQLFGPRFDPSSPPSFSGYFSRPGVQEHVGTGYELSGQNYRAVGSGDPLRPGAAYWLFPDQSIPDPDPLRLGFGSGGMRFDAQSTVQEIVVDVGTLGGGEGGGGALRQIELRALPSIGGGANADWLEFEQSDGSFAAPGTGLLIEVEDGQTLVRLTFRARREGLASSPSAMQAALVELASSEGRVRIGAELEVPGLRGLWIGQASISEVERAGIHGGGMAPSPTVPVSLILEVPDAGQPRLLPCIRVTSSRNGRNIDYRLEAALFDRATQLIGNVGSQGTSGTLSCTIAIAADDPLNPYRHRYHPEHGRGYDISRAIRLRFGTEGPSPPEDPFATVGVLGGVYEEDVTGLTQEPLRLRGAFRLRRLATGIGTPCAQ